MRKYHCKRCGNCCRAIPIDFTKKELPDDASRDFVRRHWKGISRKRAFEVISSFSGLSSKSLWFRINNDNRKKRWYACDCLDEKTNLCGCYENRPPVCRGFPFYGVHGNTNVNSGLVWEGCGFHKRKGEG